MFLRFGFANHRSFRDPVELSFIATSLAEDVHGSMPGHAAAKHGVLPMLALYGGNASGKSGALDAVDELFSHVKRSFELPATDPIPRRPFKLGGADELTRLDCDVVHDGVRYHYGFTFAADRYEEEWLYAWPEGSKQLWFHRQGRDRDAWYFGPGLKGERRRIAAATRDNCLYLSAAAQFNHDQLTAVYRCFADGCVSELGDAHHPLMYQRSPLLDADRKEQVLGLLRAADVGIVDFQVRDQRADADVVDLRAHNLDQAAERLASDPRRGGPKVLRLGHQARNGSVVFLDPIEESDGTISLMNRLHSILVVLHQGGLLVVDELDRSLHPHLCAALLRLFTDPTANPRRAQLVFSTHDLSLLHQLRRDEVVLVEKDREGASSLTRMSDFKVLKREDMQRVVAEGRVGGVPRLGDLRRWVRPQLSDAVLS